MRERKKRERGKGRVSGANIQSIDKDSVRI